LTSGTRESRRTIGGVQIVIDGDLLTWEDTAAARSCITATTVSSTALLLGLWLWLIVDHPLKSLSPETATLETCGIIGLPVLSVLIVGALIVSLKVKPLRIDKGSGHVSRGNKIIARIDQCRIMSVKAQRGGEGQDRYSTGIELWSGKRINLASTNDLREATNTANHIGEWLQIEFLLD